MLRPINSIIRDTVGNIIHRGFVVTGEIATDNGNGSYDVFIAEETKAYPKVYTLARNPDLAVGDKVRILYKNGCKELPIILPPVKPTAIVGDLIVCCFETSKIWRCKGISNEVIDTLTNITNPSSLTVANGNLISVGLVAEFDYDLYICVHRGFSNEIIDHFAPPGNYPNGLAFNGTNLISCDWQLAKIYIHSGISGSIIANFNSPSSLPRGLTIINGDLVSCDGDSDMIYVHSGITGYIKNSFASPKPYPNGLTTDGTNLISGDSGSYGVADDLIYIHSGVTETILESFSAPAGCKRINGLAYF